MCSLNLASAFINVFLTIVHCYSHFSCDNRSKRRQIPSSTFPPTISRDRYGYKDTNLYFCHLGSRWRNFSDLIFCHEDFSVALIAPAGILPRGKILRRHPYRSRIYKVKGSKVLTVKIIMQYIYQIKSRFARTGRARNK